MKILGFVMLNYGKDYLQACLQSIQDHCDKIIILYSLNPTHSQPNKSLEYWEPMKDLKEIALSFSKVEWVNVYDARSEGEHISNIWKFTDGYDILLRSDYDEVWEPNELNNAIERCYNSPYRSHGIDGFINFWRSFDYVVTDSFRPVRLTHLRERNIQQEPSIKATIYHFGYAIRKKVMEYKIAIHGHKSEWKAGWLDEWNNWQSGMRYGKFHPVSNEIWLEIKDFDKSKLPEFMRSHKFYNQEII